MSSIKCVCVRVYGVEEEWWHTEMWCCIHLLIFLSHPSPNCKLTPMHWKNGNTQEMCCELLLSIDKSHCCVIDWHGSEDHGSWLSLEGLAINPFYESWPHNIPSPFECLSHLLLSLVFLHLSLSLNLPSTSASLSQSQGHARQIDCTLIANVMMLQSTHLTCLINTTAATAVLFFHTFSHTSTHACTHLHTIIEGNACLWVHITYCHRISAQPSFLSPLPSSFPSSSTVKHGPVKLTRYTELHSQSSEETASGERNVSQNLCVSCEIIEISFF